MTQVVTILDLTSAFLALIAAYFWYRSSKLEWPADVTIDDGEAGGKGGMPEVEVWSRNASRENARGALFAAFSAIAMAVATLLQLIFGSPK